MLAGGDHKSLYKDTPGPWTNSTARVGSVGAGVGPVGLHVGSAGIGLWAGSTRPFRYQDVGISNAKLKELALL